MSNPDPNPNPDLNPNPNHRAEPGAHALFHIPRGGRGAEPLRVIAHGVPCLRPGQVSNAPALVSSMAASSLASAFSWVGGLRQQEAEPPPEENAYVYNSEIGVRPAASSLRHPCSPALERGRRGPPPWPYAGVDP